MKIIVCPHCGKEVEMGGVIPVDKSRLYTTMETNIGDICTSVRVFRALWGVQINTVAELHEYIECHGKDGLTRIHGVGEQTRKMICALYDSFMEKHSDYLDAQNSANDMQ
jgi:hypothetical protein